MDVNKVTLQYLVNPNLLNKIYGEDNNKKHSDRDFYKKRLINLTETLLESDTDNKGLNEAFDNYIFEAISYLIANDMTKTFQENLCDISFNMNDNSNNIITDISNTFNLIARQKKDNKITRFVNKKKNNKKHIFPIKKEFNHLDSKFKEPNIQ